MENKELTQYVKEEIQELLPEYNESLLEDIKLVPEEILFIYKYVSNNFDGIAAYKAVFGDDHRKALVGAKKLLARKEIQIGYNRLLDAIWAEACNILPAQLLADLNQIRELDPLDFFDDGGYPRPLSQISPEKRKFATVTFMLDRNGQRHFSYEIPKKERVTSTMLEIIRLRESTNKTKEESHNDKESVELVRSIFARIQKGDESE